MSRVETAKCARCTGRRRPLRGAAHRRAGQTGDARHRRSVRAEPRGVLAPDIAELAHQATVTDEAMPAGMFFDLATIHVLTTATLNRLRELYPQGRFEVRRFRPNIAVRPDDDDAAFVETSWVERALRIGDDVELAITDHCPRCVMTTLPQGDLLKDSGILRTAARHNEAHVGVYGKVRRTGRVQRGGTVTLG